MSVTAIVPLKNLHDSKRRLTGRLSARQRRSLMRELFLRVVDVCVAAPSIAVTLAVVGDDAGAALARTRPVDVVREPGAGLNGAVRYATRRVAPGAASLVVVADLPELTVADLEAVIDAGAAGPGVMVAPTSDGGTGALLRRPAAVIAPAFGTGSAAAHLAGAQLAGVRAGMLVRPGLARDVDRPTDLDRYAGLVADAEIYDRPDRPRPLTDR